MRILEALSAEARKSNKQFLVIGGHALNAHGYARQTGDLDLLVSSNDRDFWTTLLLSFKYKATQSHPIFERFAPDSLAEWPIDLMFVDEKVFRQLFNDSKLYDFSTVKAHIPSLNHLIALKLHALKQRQKHRESKDIDDIRQLLLISPMTLADFQHLCEKYDRRDLYEVLKGYCK